jgi:hypothetical protein
MDRNKMIVFLAVLVFVGFVTNKLLSHIFAAKIYSQKEISSVTKSDIVVYPVQMNSEGRAGAYIVKDGVVWFCDGPNSSKSSNINLKDYGGRD